MAKFICIIYTPFTGVGLHGGMRGQKWLKERIEIFKESNLKSLLNQSDKSFVHWISFRPEERNNKLVRELDEYLTKIHYAHLFTFDGLMYHDDKFTEFNVKTIVRNFSMMLWDCWRYKQFKNPFEIIKYSFQNKNKTLFKRVEKSLTFLKQFFPQADWVYLTRIDSDDMFHKDVMKLIKETMNRVYPKSNRALVMNKGYILHKQTGQVADWDPPTNPPFHTIIFPFKIFFDALAHIGYYKNYRSHESIREIFDCISLPDQNYLYLTHGKNISTYWNTNQLYLVTTGHGTNIGTRWKLNWLHTWWLTKKNPMLKNQLQKGIHPFIGKEYFGEEKKNILKEFGI